MSFDALLSMRRGNPIDRRSTRGRSTDSAKRRRYVEMVEAVRARGGESLIFSSMHESGQRECRLFCIVSKRHGGPKLTRRSLHTELNLLTGVAAILTYPLDVEVVEMEEREEEERLKLEKEAETAAQAAQ